RRSTAQRRIPDWMDILDEFVVCSAIRHLTSTDERRICESRAMHILKETLDALRRLSTPTVSNAIELFNLRPRNEGYLSPDIRCLFPDLGVMVGHAVTLRFAAEQPAVKPG